ncbi:MAG TPA: asparagine synthase (glutamine-hydrolyzing) [Natronosporangium sp.]
MCGIAGIVDYDRDFTGRSATVEAMSATLACRGPDEAGSWSRGPVSFGHRRLSVIDPAGGQQPMLATHGDGSGAGRRAVITYGGELYNFTELRETLRSLGHRFRTRCDTEVLLHAYLEWGTGFAERLNGIFACGIWDLDEQQLVLARDPLGVKPLYYWPTPTGVLFGSEPKAILAHPEVRPVVDLAGLRELLSASYTPGEAPYRGMRQVRPGELLVLRPGQGLTSRRYWRLVATEHTDSFDQTVATVRELLHDTVARQLVADVPVGTLLSGGLDSSLISALANQAVTKDGPLRTFAVDFAGYEEHFRPDFMRDAPDSPYVRQMVEHLGTDHTNVVLAADQLMQPEPLRAVLRAFDAPNGRGDRDTSMYLLFEQVRKFCTVLLSGEGADEVFGGYAWFHKPDPGTFPWLAMFGHTGDTDPVETVCTDEVVRLLALPEYRADRYRQAVAEVPVLPGEPGEERRKRIWSYLAITRLLGMMLERKDRLSMANSLEVRVPFCDHRLVQYLFNTPWAWKAHEGREKGLLREAAAGLLPEPVRYRRKAPYPATQDPLYAAALRDRVAALLDRATAPGWSLLDRRKLAELAAREGQLASNESRYAVELALRLDEWLAGGEITVDLT